MLDNSRLIGDNLPKMSTSNLDWKAEAQAVIDDMRQYVSSIDVSRELNSSDMRVYFDIKTLEAKRLLVSMDSNGFVICDSKMPKDNGLGDKPDDEQISHDKSIGNNSGKIYETINALLDDNSGEYRKAFARTLLNKIESIQGLGENY